MTDRGKRFSIITVCKNAESTIEKTILSVLEQEYKNIEFMVVDGASTDKTQDIIKKHRNRITKFVSEQDEGVYSAMNKAIGLATGDIIFFLNANDIFHDKKVLDTIAIEFNKDAELGMLYGDIITIGEKTGDKIPARFNRVSKLFLVRNTICHQAIFAKTALFHQNGLFDTKYKIAADYDWLLRMMVTNKTKCRHIQRFVADFNLSGISANSKYQKMASGEHREIATQFFGSTIVKLDSILVSFLRCGSKIKKVFAK
jgi:glycosyltransferase involved in cell wall biosynthesis